MKKHNFLRRLVALATSAAIVLSVGILSTSAETGDVYHDEDWAYWDEGDHYRLSLYVGCSDKTDRNPLVLPGYYNGKPVSSELSMSRSYVALEYPNVPEINPYSITPTYSSNALSKNKKLVELTVKHTGTVNMTMRYAAVLENVYLYCSELILDSNFNNNNPSVCVYHVTNQNVKDTLIAAGISENNILIDLESTETVDFSELRTLVESAKNYAQSDYTSVSYKALADAVAAGETVLANTDASQTDVDDAAKAINDAIAGLVKRADFSALTSALDSADKYAESDYTEESYSALSKAVTAGKAVAENTDATQTEVDSAAQAIDDAIDGLVKADGSDLFAKLQEAIDAAGKHIESDFAADSWAKLTAALSSASDVSSESLRSQIESAISAIENAENGLVIDYGIESEPLAYIYSGGTSVQLTSGTADDSVAGAAKVKFTFDCAGDVSYNPYASVEFTALVNGTESYKKFVGTDGSYKSGTTGWTETLDLTNAVNSSDSYEISGFTYSWGDAGDYVYAVQKVEFLDADGNVLKTVVKEQKTPTSDLEAAIAAAKAKADESLYTADSLAVLNGEIEKAEALAAEEKPLPSAMSAEIEALTAAVEALEYLPADYTAVDEAIASIPADLSVYTDESAAAVNEAVEAVVRGKNITEQETVDGYAKAINDAVAALEKKPDTTSSEPSNSSETSSETSNSSESSSETSSESSDSTNSSSSSVSSTSSAANSSSNKSTGNGGAGTSKTASDENAKTGAEAAGLGAVMLVCAIAAVSLKKKK